MSRAIALCAAVIILPLCSGSQSPLHAYAAPQSSNGNHCAFKGDAWRIVQEVASYVSDGAHLTYVQSRNRAVRVETDIGTYINRFKRTIPRARPLYRMLMSATTSVKAAIERADPDPPSAARFYMSYIYSAEHDMVHAWRIIKSVQCTIHHRPIHRLKRSLHVRVWVTPKSMAHNAHPVLHTSAPRGASCAASVHYTGTHAARRSFSIPARTVKASGALLWSWHEETKGSGGVATVTCRLGASSGTASARFTVRR